MLRILVLLIASAIFARGDTVQLVNSDQIGAYHGVEDTTIKSSQPDASFGGSQTLVVGSEEKTLLRFSASSLPPAAKIDHATLEIVLDKVEGDWKDAELVVYSVADADAGWSAGKADGQPENGATCWNFLLYSETKNVQTGLPMHTPMAGQKGFSQSGVDYQTTPLARIKLPANPDHARISIPLTDAQIVQGWLDHPANNPGLLLIVEGLPAGVSARALFDSSESPTTSARPTLVVETEGPTAGAVANGAIHYELKTPGFISVNVYDAQGHVVRELLHAAERSAGPHDEAWDGLDEAGQKLAPGSYSWKLLETQGLQAEYLMTLGLSVDYFDLWPGNHIGVTGLAIDESGVYFGSGCSEARGFVMKMAPDGKRLWSVNKNWFEEWQGPHSLAVDGNNLFLMQENYDVVRVAADTGNAGPIWDLVYDKTKPKDRPASTRVDGGWIKMKLGQAAETAAVDLAAGKGALVMSYENFGCIRWIDEANGKVLKETKVNEPLGVAVDNDGRALVISDGQLLAFKDTDEFGSTIIPADKLTNPWRVTVNRANGDIWIAGRGASQQVKRFSSEGKLLHVYGARGGRPAQGLYDGAVGFRNINSVAVASDGSFWITEAFAAPRRLAHFGADGKLLREWYGPQMYSNRASIDPADPSLVWMDSMWGEVIQAKVDYAKKTWTVRATYSYMDPLQERYHHENGMWFVGHNKGRTYLAKETEPNVLMVDEAGRRLVPMFKTGAAFYPGGNAGWQLPPELRPAQDPWPGQTSPQPKPPEPWSYSWYDKKGDGKISVQDMTFSRELLTFPHHSFVLPDLTYLTSIEAGWKEADNAWHHEGGGSLLHPTFSPAGATSYDLTKAGNLPLKGPDFIGAIRCLWEDSDRNIFTAHNTAKTRTGQKAFGVGKTASGLGGNYVAKWGSDGTLKWIIGHHTAEAKPGPGEARMLYRMAGSVKGCIAVNDIDYSMTHVWDQDGLWVGRLLDHGLITPTIPADAYVLCGENFGGYLFENSQDGQVYFFGDSYNATPVYRITGWDKFERQSGAIDVK
jgi:DNA-binding beta-propeller fold protein YncE